MTKSHVWRDENGKPTRDKATCARCGLKRMFRKHESVTYTQTATYYSKKMIPVYSSDGEKFREERPACT